MKYDWIIDVITDLETFSCANNMQALAAELAELKLLAAVEIATKEAHEANRKDSAAGRHGPH